MKKIHIAVAVAIAALCILLLVPSTAAYKSEPTATTTPRRALTHAQEVWLGYVVQSLINCESSGRNVKIVDTNGYYSYGILQFQKSTWQDFSKQSGIVGDPMVPEDAIVMTKWAILNGYASRWTCWKSVPSPMRQMPT